MKQGEVSRQPIRVLCVFGVLDHGGAESMCMALFRAMDRNKVVFDFVKHTEAHGAFEDEIRALGGLIYTCPPLTVSNYFRYIRWWDKHFETHPEHQIIHGHMFTTSGLYFREAHKYGRITVGHSHCADDKNVDERTHIEQFVRKKLRDMIPRYADHKFACSRKAGELLFHDNDFIIVNNAIETQNFVFNAAVREEKRKSYALSNELVLGTVANLSVVKNPMGLIDIYIAVKKRLPSARLVWAGEGEQRSAIESRLKMEGIEKSVTLLGTCNDVYKMLQAIDVFLLPSFFEGLPVSAIEAQAAGLPCFISDRVTREVDITGLCHFLPIDKPDLWVDAILSDHTPRADTSVKIIEAGYDTHTTAKWLEEFYLSLVE